MFGAPSQWMYETAGGFYDYQIDGSLRFNDDDTAYLNRTPSSVGNRKTYTWSGWLKLGSQTNTAKDLGIFTAHSANGANNENGIILYETNKIVWTGNNFGSGMIETAAFLRDQSGWYHIVVAIDTTQATASNRVKIYINGVLQTSFSTTTYPSQNFEAYINNTSPHKLGNVDDGASTTGDLFDGYMAEVNFIDGQALTADSFGETKSGVWIPKEYSGSYGTNGFHLKFAGNTNDSSGNGNNWTANNISSYDYVPDSPTNNFCTWNGVNKGFNVTTYEGNTYARQTASSSGTNQSVTGSMGAFSGKWYFEAYAENVLSGYGQIVGVAENDYATINGFLGTKGFGYRTNGQKQTGSTLTNYGASYSTGDIIGVALDIDGGTLTFYKNGVSQGTAFTGLSGGFVPHAGMAFSSSQGNGYRINAGQDSTFAGQTTAGGNSDANGYGDFKYSVPSGYLALCTANLPVPEAVDPASDNSPQDYFNIVLYTGNGTTQNITGVGFQPDLVWIKNRNYTYSHVLVDSLRGVAYKLFPDTASQEVYDATSVTNFNTDGFTVGSQIGVNRSGYTYVSWNWKAGGSGVTNTEGSITSVVSANTDAGFSMAGYSGVGGSPTFGHGLSVAPELIIIKGVTEAQSWYVFGDAIGASGSGNFLRIDLNSTKVTGSASSNVTWNSSTIGLDYNTGINRSGKDYICYSFHSVEGFSAFGTYIGNSSTNGPFVYTGFRPAFVIIKDTNATNSWQIQDSAREPYNDHQRTVLRTDTSVADVIDNYPLDFVSNGFKIRNSGSGNNQSGRTYLYIAFAENPFKYANAR